MRLDLVPVAQLRLRHVVQRNLTGGRVIGGFHGLGTSFLGMDAAYCCGVQPAARRKTLEKYRWSSKPAMAAT